MLSFQLTYCKNCGSIDDVQKILDFRIVDLARRKFNEIVYLEKSKLSKRESKDLLYYREILEHLKWNPEYFDEEFTKDQIISRVKSLF